MKNIIIWLFGIGAMLSLFAAYQQKKREKLIFCKLCADICWVGHYILLGAYGGMVPNFVGIFRELVFARREKSKWADKPIIPILFICLNWTIGAFTFERPINILPIVASTFVTISLWVRSPRLTKTITIPIAVSFWIYNFIVGSYIGVINESLSLLSIWASFIKERFKMKESIFHEDFKTEKEEILIERSVIGGHAGVIRAEDASEKALLAGETFAKEIEARFVADFEKKGIDKMVHVTTFKPIDGMIYMSYYANTAESSEDPNNQTARFAFCPENDTENMTILDIMAVGDTLSDRPVRMVYDTIFAQIDAETLYILWTAKVGDVYYRLYRPFDLKTETLGEVGVNRFKVGNVTNDFSSSGIISALTENGIGHKKMFSDIGIMQKFTSRVENGVTYYYTGAYSGDLNVIIKSRDFITWEYVSHPDFPSASKWENATYVIGDKCYYFVRQHDEESCGFLTVYDLEAKTWEPPVLIEDCQSRSDFIEYGGELYMVHAPIDREHIGFIRIDKENIANSRAVMQADMHGSCFYPFVDYFKDGELAMSYTVDRKHVRLARFDMKNYI